MQVFSSEWSCNMSDIKSHMHSWLLQAFKSLQMLIMSVLTTSVDDKHRNPMWPAMGYPGAMQTCLYDVYLGTSEIRQEITKHNCTQEIRQNNVTQEMHSVWAHKECASGHHVYHADHL